MSEEEKEAVAMSVRKRKRKRKRTSYVDMMEETMARNTSAATKLSLPPAVVPEKVKTI